MGKRNSEVPEICGISCLSSQKSNNLCLFSWITSSFLQLAANCSSSHLTEFLTPDSKNVNVLAFLVDQDWISAASHLNRFQKAHKLSWRATGARIWTDGPQTRRKSVAEIKVLGVAALTPSYDPLVWKREVLTSVWCTICKEFKCVFNLKCWSHTWINKI